MRPADIPGGTPRPAATPVILVPRQDYVPPARPKRDSTDDILRKYGSQAHP